MSAIDQAFVKAFAKETMRRPHFPSDEESVAGGHPMSVEGPHAAVPAPHAAFAVRSGSPSSGDGRAARVLSRQEPPTEELPENNNSTTSLVEPAFEVDRFAWPEVCQQILRQSAVEMNRLTEVLKDVGASGEAETVLVTACQAGEGKSTLLLSLALSLAEQYRRVVLVDGDFQRGGLAEQLGIAPLVGIDDVLRKSTPASEAMVESVADSITLIPLRKAGDEGDELPRHPRWEATLAMLKQQYDVVIISGQPLGRETAKGEQPVWQIPTFVDMAVLVHDERVTQTAELEQATMKLRSGGVKHLTIVDNFVRPSATHAA